MSFTLYEIDYFDLTITKKCDVRACSNAVAPSASLSDTLVKVAECCDYVTEDDLYIGDIPKWVKIYSDHKRCPNKNLNKFMKTNKIVLCIGVDCDESNSYVVIEN